MGHREREKDEKSHRHMQENRKLHEKVQKYHHDASFRRIKVTTLGPPIA